MPRRKAVSIDQMLNNDPPLMLPPPRTAHKHQHDLDPYESPPGAVPVRITSEPIKRKMNKADIEARKEARLEAKMLGARYVRYIEAMSEFNGDQEQALAEAYGISVDEVRPQRLELHADVLRGLGSTTLGEVLEQHDLSINARTNLLRKHAYSNNPAASLKAIDMVGEMEGDRSDVGSFESYLRTVKSQTK